jgi:predicted signal transduction protein with EAL and GGDEF domain
VKIDRSFVLGMTTDPDDAAVVGSIIDLARALGLRVVAEGVEDDETRRMLMRGGCEVGQGWYYARPMPADALANWLARYRATAPTPSEPDRRTGDHCARPTTSHRVRQPTAFLRSDSPRYGSTRATAAAYTVT